MELISYRKLFNKQIPSFSPVNCTGTEHVNTEAFAISVCFPRSFLHETLTPHFKAITSEPQAALICSVDPMGLLYFLRALVSSVNPYAPFKGS